MRDSDYYAPGSNTPDAPWNDSSNPERDFDLEVTETVSRKTYITSDNYNIYVDYEDGRTTVDTDPVEFAKCYEEQRWSIVELIDRMKAMLEKWRPSEMSKKDKAEYDRILEEVDGWEAVDMEITDHE